MTFPLESGVNPDSLGGIRVGDGSIPGQGNNSQGAVENTLKALYVRDNPAISGPLGLVYGVLRAGISLPLAILELIANKLRGTTTTYLSIEHVAIGIAQAGGNVINGFAAIFNAWFGVNTAAGTPEEVAITVEAIRAAVAGGYTLQTFTVSNPAWPVPPELANAAEAWAGVIGGGGRGEVGEVGLSAPGGTVLDGGIGGVNGGYVSAQFDPSTLGATVAIVIGAGASTPGANGGVSSIGSIVESNPDGGGIATVGGYQPTTSKPGNGGKGGGLVVGSTEDDGEDGAASVVGHGGAGGAGSSGIFSGAGGTGGTGGIGETSDTPICGGGGGGGGGARQQSTVLTTATGGHGGVGGYPGGGSGGGGAVANVAGGSVISGQPGAAPHGLGFFLWR